MRTTFSVLAIAAVAYAFTPANPTASAPEVAGATFTIDNSTNCAYTATVYHSNACPAVGIPSTNTLSIPGSTNGSTINVSGAVINKVEIDYLGTIFATWNCTSATSGSWTLNNSTTCLFSGFHAIVQGNGYATNKIDWAP